MDQLAYTQPGQSWSKVGLYQRRVKKLIITNPKPVRVICKEDVNVILMSPQPLLLTRFGLRQNTY